MLNRKTCKTPCKWIEILAWLFVSELKIFPEPCKRIEKLAVKNLKTRYALTCRMVLSDVYLSFNSATSRVLSDLKSMLCVSKHGCCLSNSDAQPILKKKLNMKILWCSPQKINFLKSFENLILVTSLFLLNCLPNDDLRFQFPIVSKIVASDSYTFFM